MWRGRLRAVLLTYALVSLMYVGAIWDVDPNRNLLRCVQLWHPPAVAIHVHRWPSPEGAVTEVAARPFPEDPGGVAGSP